MRLIRAAGLVGTAAAILAWPSAAQAQMVRELRQCATQTESLADQRIAACTSVLNSGRLHGEPLGVAYGLRGLAYLDRGDIPHAIGDLNNAIQFAPDFAPAYQNRGNAWYARGNYGQALADYDATIRLDPNSASPYVNRATVRRDLGYIEGALEDYAKAISLDANRATPYSGRGELYLRQHDYARAVADFDHAIRLQPDAGNYMLRGQAHVGAGDLDKAIGDFQEAARLDPKNIGALTAQASVWRKKGDLDKAIAVYDRAVSADQRRPATYKLRAETYAAKGDRKRALADIGRALKFSWNADLLKVRASLRLDDGDINGVGTMSPPWRCAAPRWRARKITAARSPISIRRSRPTTRTPSPSARAARSIWRRTTMSVRWPTSAAPSNWARPARGPISAAPRFTRIKATPRGR
jgi:tetratricopeptide (TPR) repeat protein